MTYTIDIRCTKHVYTVWINGRIFLSQPIHYTNQIPVNVTPKLYWYLHILNVLQQHGLLAPYTKKLTKI